LDPSADGRHNDARLDFGMSALTVIVPTFNEAENVAALVEQLVEQLQGVDAEILFVDDSTDRTPDVILNVAKVARLPVRLLHRDRPEGRLSGAVIAGLKASKSTWAVVMDGDLQHPPATVPTLFDRGRSASSDVVVASRYLHGGNAGGLNGRFRYMVSYWSGWLAKTLFPRRLARCTDPLSGFFAVRRDALELDAVTQCGYKILLALLLHRELTVTEVPFHFAARHAGESKASFREGLRFLRLLVILRASPGIPLAAAAASGLVPNLLAALAFRFGVGGRFIHRKPAPPPSDVTVETPVVSGVV
jgi:dolichol-phosphate mannosyltransferase